MKVRIYSTNYYEYDMLLAEYPCLKEYNIERIEAYDYQIEISTLQDIMDLCNKTNNDLIFKRDWKEMQTEWAIEIYDGYRE